MFLRENEGTSSSSGLSIFGGFRRKTLETLVKYAVSTSTLASESSEDPLSRETFNLIRTSFEEQDENLKQLHIEITHLFTHIQNICSCLLRVMDFFMKSFQTNEKAIKQGNAYLNVVKLFSHEAVELMEQTIRFTVLDPLETKLQRHQNLKVKILKREIFLKEMKELKLEIELLRLTRKPDKDERRHQQRENKFKSMNLTLEEIEKEIIQELKNELENPENIQNQVDLFNAMKLQVATFFYHAQLSLFTGLSSTEQELVTGNSILLRRSSTSNDTAPLTLEGSYDESVCADATEILTHDEVSYASIIVQKEVPVDVDPPKVVPVVAQYLQSNPSVFLMTKEDFHHGKSSPKQFEYHPPTIQIQQQHQEALDQMSGECLDPQTLALVSDPVVVHTEDPTFCEPNNETEYQNQSEKISTSAENIHQVEEDDIQDENELLVHKLLSPTDSSSNIKVSATVKAVVARQNTSVFNNLKRSLQDRLNAATSLQKSSSSFTKKFQEPNLANPIALTAKDKRVQQSILPVEWQHIEAKVWDMDVGNCTNARHLRIIQKDFQFTKDWTPKRALVENDGILFKCCSYLSLEDLVRLSRSNRTLYNSLVKCPAVWKRSIRQGGILPHVRSSIWLSLLYGETPWKQGQSLDLIPGTVVTSNILTSSLKRKQIYEKLLLKAAKQLEKARNHHESDRITDQDPDDEKFNAWFHEIDVDVIRTCNKNIYDKDVAEEWGTETNKIFPLDEQTSPRSAFACVVASALSKEDIALTRATVPTIPTSITESVIPKRIFTREQESKLRRILRAYVMYNPRVGYCQGMNFIVRLLMEVTDQETDVFWLFVGFCEPESGRNLYEPEMKVLQPFFYRLEEMLRLEIPDLFQHFQREGIQVSSFSARWFLTLFSSFETFGPTTVIRLLDVFVVDGWEILFAMALVVLRELKDVLVEAELEDILRILRFPRNYMQEPDHIRRKQLLRHAIAIRLRIASPLRQSLHADLDLDSDSDEGNYKLD